MKPALLAVLLALATRTPRQTVQAHADAIASVTPHPEEQLALAAIDFQETSLGYRGIPFGVSRYAHRMQRAGVSPSLEDFARVALTNVRAAHAACATEWQAASWHQSGACLITSYGASLLRWKHVMHRATILVEHGVHSSIAVQRVREIARMSRPQS